MTLHLAFTAAYYRFQIVRRLVPNFLKVGKEKIPMRPMMAMDEEHFPKLNPQKRKKKALIIKHSKLGRALSRRPSTFSTKSKTKSEMSIQTVPVEQDRTLETDEDVEPNVEV